jgi:hypothetical protein
LEKSDFKIEFDEAYERIPALIEGRNSGMAQQAKDHYDCMCNMASAVLNHPSTRQACDAVKDWITANPNEQPPVKNDQILKFFKDHNDKIVSLTSAHVKPTTYSKVEIQNLLKVATDAYDAK